MELNHFRGLVSGKRNQSDSVRVRFLLSSVFLALTDTVLGSVKQSHTSEGVQTCKSGKIHLFPCDWGLLS